MARSFEEMEVWKTARKLVDLVYRLTKMSEFRKDYSLSDQIRRAAVSVMSNMPKDLKGAQILNLFNFSTFQKALQER